MATTIGVPTVTARRALEELAYYGIVDRRSRDETGGRAIVWRLSDATRDRLAAGGVSEIRPYPIAKASPHSSPPYPIIPNFGNGHPHGAARAAESVAVGEPSAADRGSTGGAAGLRLRPEGDPGPEPLGEEASETSDGGPPDRSFQGLPREDPTDWEVF